MTAELTPPQPAAIQAAPDWRQSAADWLTNLGSDRTRRAYLQAWNSFLAFAGRDPASITQSDVLAYRRFLETIPSPRTGRPVARRPLTSI